MNGSRGSTFESGRDSMAGGLENIASAVRIDDHSVVDLDSDYCDGYESADLSLDDNGFPDGNGRDRFSHVEDEEEEETFLSEFYKAGTDWSCLLSEIDNNRDEIKEEKRFRVSLEKNKKMKQANLLQIWGLEKKKTKLSSNKEDITTMGNSVNFHSLTKQFHSSATPSTARKRLKEGQVNQAPRCPFYKKIPGTPITVDAFRYGCIQGCSAYFLTHFHSDHYCGLSKGWSHGPIYCTSLTARLLKICLSINPLFICPLELDVEYTIEGVKVTLLDANHCPGAALIHLRLSNGHCYLHTGDFRASKQMQSHPLLVNQRVNVLYLDTTYCNPRYKFPSKEDVLTYVVRITKKTLKRQQKTLVVVGAYSIGKECVYLALAEALGVKIFANASRRRVLQSFGWPDLSNGLCREGRDTLLHVLPMSWLRVERLRDYLKNYTNQYAAVLAFRPTGWTYSETTGNQLDLIRPISRGNITIYGVPYSEHSSFTELRDFIQFLRPEKIIPTVNISNAASRNKMQSYFREWLRNGVLPAALPRIWQENRCITS